MILRLIPDSLLIVVFLLVCAGIGGRLLSLAGVEEARGPERTLLLPAAAGMFAVSYAVFLGGYLGLLTRPVIAFAAAAALFFFRGGIKDVLCWRPEAGGGRWTAAEKTLAAVIAAAVIFNLFYNYCPPTAEDEITTHLGLPARWAAAGGIYAVPGASAQYFPSGMSMIYLLLTAAGSPQTARLFHYACGLLSLAAVFMLAGRYLGRRAALLAAAIFYTMPAVTSLSGVGNTDLGTLFYALLSVSAFVRWLDGRERGWFVASAIMAGASAACKYTAFPLLILLPLAVVWEKRSSPAAALKAAAAFAALSWPALLPYLARNTLMTGNPLFPAAFAGLPHDGILALVALKPQGAREFFSMIAGFSAAGGWIWGVGPLFGALLPFMPFYPVRGRGGRPLTPFLLYAAVGSVVLLFGARICFQMTRYSMLSFALLAVAAAAAAEGLAAERGLRRYCAALISLSLASVLVLPLYFGGKRLPVFAGFESREDYFSREYSIMEGSAAVGRIRSSVPSGAGIFFLSDLAAPQLNYPDHRLFGMDAFPPEFYALSLPGASDVMKGKGVTHVLVFWDNFEEAGGVFRWRPAGDGLPVRWLGRGLGREIFSDGRLSLYELTPERS